MTQTEILKKLAAGYTLTRDEQQMMQDRLWGAWVTQYGNREFCITDRGRTILEMRTK